jgi:hypothetical protein
MKSSLMRRASILAVPLVTAATWTGFAMAQGAPPPPAPAPATPPAPPPAAAPAPPPPPAAPAAAAPAAKWYEKAKVEGFVDAYANLNFNFPKPQTGTNLGRAFDASNGFALHWAGLNASYAPDPVGGFVGLRFGPGAGLYNAGVDNQNSLTYVKQAFVAWKPGGGQLELDFGKFDTWIGGEVADTQYNMTYTRSTLFFFQPLFHTGLRLDYAVSDQLDLKFFAVNGWNNSVDNNSGKTFGVSVGITPQKTMAFYINYIGGPEQTDSTVDMMGNVRPVPDANSRWRHLIDGVADLHFDQAHVLVNVDFGTEKFVAVPSDKSSSFFGGNLTVGYAVNDMFALAVRGGYFSDADGAFAPPWAPAGFKASDFDGTLTLAFTPTPNLIIKLEPRIDAVSSDAPAWNGSFPKAPDATAPQEFSKTMFTTTLGMVVTTN